MPLDRSHQHISSDVMDEADPHTPISPGGGAGIPQGGPLSADLAAGAHKITGLADPAGAQDAATKAYVLATATSVTVSDDDPGAIGANALWVQTDTVGGNYPTLQMWIRNAADDGWMAVGVGSSYDDGTGDPKVAGNWNFATGRMAAGIRVESTNVVMSSWSPVSDVTKVRTAEIGQPGFRITSSADGALVAFWLLGTADPTAGSGVVADVSSIYSRTNGSAGELWVKTGAADTAWFKVTP